MDELGCTVNMSSSAGVMAWEDGLELDDAFFVAGLNSTEKGCVQVGGVGGITVAICLNTRVYTL